MTTSPSPSQGLGERRGVPYADERTRLAIEAGGLGTWSYDAGTGHVDWDEAMERMFGLPPGGFDGTYDAYLRLVHPEDREEVVRSVGRSLEQGGSHRVQHRVIWPDGSVHWIEGWGRALSGETGAPGGLVGVAVDITERRRSEARLRQVQRVTSALARALTTHEVGQVAIHELVAATDAIGSTLMLLDDDGTTMRVTATSLPDAQLPDEWRVFDVNSSLSGAEAVRTGELIVRPIDEAEGPSALVARLRDAGDASMVIALPLRAGERTLGAIGLALAAYDPHDEATAAFLLTIGRQLGQALERAMLHEATLEASARIRLLADAGSVLGRSLDYRQTVSQVAASAVPGFADWCAVDLLDEGGELQLLAVAHVDPDKVELARRLRADHPPDPDAPSGAAAVARNGRSELLRTIPPALLEETAARFPDLAELIRELRLTSWMSVPLIARGRTLGVMSFVWGESGRHYDEDDLLLAEQLASRAAVAIDNARLFDEQRTVADTLQTSLRPPELPAIRGIEVAAAYRPGGAHGEVAGDFYDVFALREGSWLAVTGDVCGKGVDAAAVMALARYTIRTAALTRSRPSGILATLNEALLRSGFDRFCTACAVRIDEPDHRGVARATVSSGGHPQPLHVRADGADLVEVRGTLLGVFEDPDLTDLRLDLGAGESLVLYTDGVVEERRDGEPFGEERLRGIGAGAAATPAEELAGRIMEAVRGFASGPPADDIAILAMRNTG